VLVAMARNPATAGPDRGPGRRPAEIDGKKTSTQDCILEIPEGLTKPRLIIPWPRPGLLECGLLRCHAELPFMRSGRLPKCRAVSFSGGAVDYDTRVASPALPRAYADEVSDKTRANFCGHYKPRTPAYTAPRIRVIIKSMRAGEPAVFGQL